MNRLLRRTRTIYHEITISRWKSLILFSCLLALMEFLIYISYRVRDSYWLNKFGAYADLREMIAYLVIASVAYTVRYFGFPDVLDLTGKPLGDIRKKTRIYAWLIILCGIVVSWLYELGPFGQPKDRYVLSPLIYSFALTLLLVFAGFGGEIYLFVFAKYLHEMKRVAQLPPPMGFLSVKQQINDRIDEAVREGFKLAICVTVVSLVIVYIAWPTYRTIPKNILEYVLATLTAVIYVTPILFMYLAGQKQKYNTMKEIDKTISELAAVLSRDENSGEQAQETILRIKHWRDIRELLENTNIVQQRFSTIARLVPLVIPILQNVLIKSVQSILSKV